MAKPSKNTNTVMISLIVALLALFFGSELYQWMMQEETSDVKPSVKSYLADIRLDQYANIFEEHGVDDLASLEALTEAELEAMGLTFSDQVTLTSRLGRTHTLVMAAAAKKDAENTRRMLEMVDDLLSNNVDEKALAAKYGGERGSAILWRAALTYAQQVPDEAKWQFILGTCLLYGRGGAVEDKVAAVAAFRRAADNGHAHSQVMMGMCYANAWGVEWSSTAAVAWYRRAAEQKHPHGSYMLAGCYRQGWGVDIDVQQALEWFERAGDYADAVNQTLRLRAEQKHHDEFLPRAIEMVDDFLGGRADTATMEAKYANVELWRPACVHAQQQLKQHGAKVEPRWPTVLAACHLWATGGVSENPLRAVELLREPASAEFAGAQLILAWCYHNGWGVPTDEGYALKWYRRASERGHAYAQFNLGECYERGTCGVTKDLKRSLALYQSAAEKGRGDAAARVVLVEKAINEGESAASSV